MLEKTFQPADIEPRIRSAWTDAQAFKAGASGHAKTAGTYCIVIPPPNVTGSLHMGHALNNTLQDVLIRFERMRGKDVLWQPGTDHAGIATQMVVERKLAAEQQPGRRDLGREKFLEKVWTWKAESGGTIVNQLKRLGASCDWDRERFTMDEGLSRAVLKVFVELHKAGLIYKDKRLVNWDPKFQTAISDLEVVQIEKKGSFKWTRGDKDETGAAIPLDNDKLGKVLDREPAGHMYYFNYPLDGAKYDPDNAETFLTVATTRPETMLGDTAVAVHPEHPEYGEWIGRTLILPLTGRKIPIIGDDYADPEKGTGAVKITPAHDFNDFEVGRRHAAELVAPINIFDAFAKLKRTCPRPIAALTGSRRARGVADLDAQHLVSKDRAERAYGAARRPFRRRRRAVADRPVVRQRRGVGEARARGRRSRARPSSCRELSPTTITAGWRTFSRGAFHASFGGAIRSPRGTGQTVKFSLRPRLKKQWPSLRRMQMRGRRLSRLRKTSG